MNQTYKSRIFNESFLEDRELEIFKKDIIILNEIEPGNWENIFSYIKRIVITKTEKEDSHIRDELLKSNLLKDYSTIYSAQRIIIYFLKKFSSEEAKEDGVDVVTRDIELLVEKECLNSIKSLFEIIKKESIWYESYKTQRSYDIGLLPFLKGIGTTVELRGIFNKEIEFSEESESYIKEVEINKEKSIVPTITMALTLDSGTPSRFCFQLSPERANWLIEELKAALHKAKLLEESYKK